MAKMKYRVFVDAVVSVEREIEAETFEEARDAALCAEVTMDEVSSGCIADTHVTAAEAETGEWRSFSPDF